MGMLHALCTSDLLLICMFLVHLLRVLQVRPDSTTLKQKTLFHETWLSEFRRIDYTGLESCQLSTRVVGQICFLFGLPSPLCRWMNWVEK